jgi:hypothetical protein
LGLINRLILRSNRGDGENTEPNVAISAIEGYHIKEVITKQYPTQLVGWEKLDIFQTRITHSRMTKIHAGPTGR